MRAATCPAPPLLPWRGLSTLGVPGGPYDPSVAEALFTAARDGPRGGRVRSAAYDTHLDDPGFGRAAADRSHADRRERLRPHDALSVVRAEGSTPRGGAPVSGRGSRAGDAR